MPDSIPETRPATPELLALHAEYERAKVARGRWEAEEKRLKEELFAALSYDPEDPKPSPVDVVDGATGEVAFSVRVGTWRGMDFKAMRDERPDIMAQYETSKATKSIKSP